MKHNAFLKDIRREIFHTVGRFLSVFLIVAIGCGFFAGIKATMPYMKNTAADYFKENNLMDIRLQSTIGIKSDDVLKLSKLDFVKGIMPSYSKDVFYEFNNDNIVLKAMSYTDKHKGNDALNKLVVLDGRLPSKSGECVVEKKIGSPKSFEIGESIKISSSKEDTLITDSLTTDTYEIVGIAVSPLYIGYKRDKTDVGNGSINSNIFLPEEDFIDDYYSELYLSVNGLDEYEPFSDEYKNKVDEYIEKAKSALEESVLSRFDDYKSDAEEKIRQSKSYVKDLENICGSNINSLLEIKESFEENISSLELRKSKEKNKTQLLLIDSMIKQKQESLNQISRLIKARKKGDNSVDEELRHKIKSAESQIKESEKNLSDVDKPRIYATTRFDSDDYSSYENDSEKIDMIAKVFPVFFIIVTALICLTTMTRMVEENRTQIGIYKALGYSSFKISLKYLIYASVPTVLGSVIGVIIGLRIFPKIIYQSYKILYNIPSLNTPFKLDYCIWCMSAALVCVLVTVFYAINKELRAVPSRLMRPKSPPNGKRVFLENINFIWKRLDFLTKVTLRNLFRYKKRFLMTVLGIAGCTGLIVTAFGLKHSISAIIDKQFDNVYKYDAAVMLNTDKIQDINSAQKELENISGVKDSIPLCIDSYTAADENGSQNSVSLVAVSDSEKLSGFVSLQNRKSGEKYTVSENGVVVTEKLCRLLEIDVGDTLNLSDADGNVYKMKVGGIAENYASHFIYISSEMFETVFKKAPLFNSFYIHVNEAEDSSNISRDIVASDNFLGVSFISEIGDSFADTLGSLNSIVILLIVCAGALAIVVIYNLSNINITERIREIATIKVLGFYDSEVSAYIIRENILSTLIGIFIGWIFGAFLHRFVVLTSEVDIVMFDRNLVWWAFAAAFVLTAMFSLIVNFILYFKLKKIQMVESLKSVE